MKPEVEIIEIYVQRKATGGATYETGCLICQGKGSGLINIVPIPTHRTACYDREEKEWVFRYVCRDCTLARGKPKELLFVWIDKLPLYPDDLAITEIPKQFENGEWQIDGRELEEWYAERNLNPDDYREDD